MLVQLAVFVNQAQMCIIETVVAWFYIIQKCNTYSTAMNICSLPDIGPTSQCLVMQNDEM